MYGVAWTRFMRIMISCSVESIPTRRTWERAESAEVGDELIGLRLLFRVRQRDPGSSDLGAGQLGGAAGGRLCCVAHRYGQHDDDDGTTSTTTTTTTVRPTRRRQRRYGQHDNDNDGTTSTTTTTTTMMISTATLTSDEHDGDNYDDNNDDDGDDNHQTMPSDDDDDVVVVVDVVCLSLFSLMMVQLALPDDLQRKLSKFDCAPDIIALVIATLCKVCTPPPPTFLWDCCEWFWKRIWQWW